MGSQIMQSRHKENDDVSEIEDLILSYWSEIINVNRESIDLSCSLFDMGGDSLKVSFLINRIWEKYEIEFDLKELFESPDVPKLAQLIRIELRKRSDNLTKEDYEVGVI